MKKSLYIFLILILVGNQTKATSQFPDVLFLGKDTLYFYDSPLEEIEGIAGKIGELREELYVVYSGCWRGFRAEWKIVDDVLYLSNVYDCTSEKNLNSIIEEILGIKFTDGLIEAIFVDGTYWAGRDQVHEQSFYIPIYKHETQFAIKGGVIENSKKLNSIPCEYSDKEDLKNFILENLNHCNMNDLKGESIGISAIIKSDKTGKIKEVKIEDSTHSETNGLFKDAIMKLPCRPVYFNKGKYWSSEELIYLSIKTEELKEYVR